MVVSVMAEHKPEPMPQPVADANGRDVGPPRNQYGEKPVPWPEVFLLTFILGLVACGLFIDQRNHAEKTVTMAPPSHCIMPQLITLHARTANLKLVSLKWSSPHHQLVPWLANARNAMQEFGDLERLQPDFRANITKLQQELQHLEFIYTLYDNQFLAFFNQLFKVNEYATNQTCV